MHPDAAQALLNASSRASRKARRVRRAVQANGVAGEPEGTKHVKDPWNTMWSEKEMRLHMSYAARETLGRLKHGKP